VERGGPLDPRALVAPVRQSDRTADRKLASMGPMGYSWAMASDHRQPGSAEPRSDQAAEPANASDEARGLLLEIASRSGRPMPASPEAAVATVVGIDEQGRPLVQGADWPAPQPARSVVPIELTDVGREAAVAFEGGDATRPLVLGLLQPAVMPADAEQAEQAATPVQVECDGERVELRASREIVLRCGKASITLTRAGKILIRGAYVSSRSTGVNRIFGGAVEIN
jgi:hypothetical protein